MSDTPPHAPNPQGPATVIPATVIPATVIPARQPAPPPPPPRGAAGLGCLLAGLFAAAILVGVPILLLTLMVGSVGSAGESSLGVEERLHAGKSGAKDKIAIIQIDGVILEGTLGFAHKQIDKAAADGTVKAVVVRINSPGGSITASDDLHRRLTALRDGTAPKSTGGKPLVVSMGSLAASGGYYIAMPAQALVAERTTMTGSIGVYASFPNVAELGQKVGFSMETVKVGEIKDSGSPFKRMGDKEREVWQHLVDHAYLQFLAVVEEGRPKLKGKLQEDLVIKETLPVRSEKGPQKQVNLVRYRADGGIFTAQEALQYGLVDQIGYLDDAVQVAQAAANLGADYKVIKYERPLTLFGALMGVEAKAPAAPLDASRLAAAATPRMWYLAPQSELAGLLTAAGNP